MRKIKKFVKGEDPGEYLEQYYNEFIDDVQTILQRILLGENFDSDIVEVTLPANTELAIPHRLDVTPKYRMILRQSAGASISDGSSSQWDSSNIYLENNSANDTKITVMIMRG